MTSHYTPDHPGGGRMYWPDLRFSNARVLAFQTCFRSSEPIFCNLAYMTTQPRPPLLKGGQDGRPGCYPPTSPITTACGRLTARPWRADLGGLPNPVNSRRGIR